MAILSPLAALQSPIIYFLVFVASTCFTIYYRVYFRQVARWKQSNIPFLQSVFLKGHKYLSRESSVTVAIDKIYRENQDKDLVGFFLGTAPVILVQNPKLIHQLFTKETSRLFGTGLSLPETEEEAQYMILTSNQKIWKFSRTKLAPMLSPLRVGGLRFNKIKAQVDKLGCHVKKAESNGQPVSLKEIMENFIIDTNSLWLFGEDSNSYEKKGVFHTIIDRFFETSLSRRISFYVFQQFPSLQAFKPLKIVSHKSCTEMAEFLHRKITHRDQLNINEDDFVDFLRSLRGNPASKEKDSGNFGDFQDHEGINMKQMVGFSLAVLIAGSDTVSALCVTAVHLLSLHPEHQDHIRREVREAMKKHGVSELEFQVVQELQFTLQCLYETARLYPMFPLMTRHCTEDFQIPGTKYFLRKGDKIAVSPYPMQRDPKYFQTPNKFDPDRFSAENKNSISPETYLSFGIGCRKCPGYKQGFLIAATLVASLLHRYEVKPRSHLRQMDATDFHPKSFRNVPARDIIVDLVRCEDLTST